MDLKAQIMFVQIDENNTKEESHSTWTCQQHRVSQPDQRKYEEVAY